MAEQTERAGLGSDGEAAASWVPDEKAFIKPVSTEPKKENMQPFSDSRVEGMTGDPDKHFNLEILQTEVVGIEERLLKMESEISSLKEARRIVEKERDDLKAELDKAKIEISELKQELHDLQCEDPKQEREKFSKKYEEVSKGTMRVEKEVEELMEKLTKLKKEVQTLEKINWWKVGVFILVPVCWVAIGVTHHWVVGKLALSEGEKLSSRTVLRFLNIEYENTMIRSRDT